MLPSAKYTNFEIVRIPGENIDRAAIRDISFLAEDGVPRYTLRTPDGHFIEKREEELEATGQFEAPIRFDEIVRLCPKNPEYAHMIGEQVVVVGVSVDDTTGKWGYAVLRDNGQGWSFLEDEVESTGEVAVREAVEHRHNGRQNRIKTEQI
jgi:hypothetical protein